VIVFTPLLDVAAGALLHAEQPALVAQPGLLILIPPFVSQAGALGGILASRISSKLQLGVISPRGLPEPAALLDGAIVVIFGAVVFLAVGVGATVLADTTTRTHPGAAQMIGGTMLAGALVMPLILVVGYGVAAMTARYGLDPDDQSVPVITSVMDLVGVSALLLSMSLLGVLSAGA
jgi:mgtE-like transporter